MDGKPAKPARNGDGIGRGLLTNLLGYHLRRAQVAVFQHFAASVGAAEITPGSVAWITSFSSRRSVIACQRARCGSSGQESCAWPA